MNPMFNALGGGQGPMNDFQKMVQQFRQFQANYHGDPKAEVERMLQSGRVSQAQLNQVQSMARQLMQLMK